MSTSKLQFAEAIKECLKTDTLDDITVTQISDTAGLSRQTFYRLFLDKYDLVNWYFDQLLFQSFEEMGIGKSITEGLKNKFDFIKKEERFFNSAFQSSAQNSLVEHDYTQILNFYEKLIESKSKTPIPRDIQFALEMYCYASVIKTVEWLKNGTKVSSQTLAELLIKSMPQNLKLYFMELEIII